MRPPSTMNGQPGRPPAGEGDRGRSLTRRQYVRFAFYRVAPEWRRLPAAKQEAGKRELAEVIRGFNRKMLLRPYSLVGTRNDAELLLWQITESPVPFRELATAISNTHMGGYLEMTYSYFSQTKRSIYEIRMEDETAEGERLVIDPSEAKFLYVYPFIKTRPWYQLPMADRQRMIDEHITVGRKYPSIRLNTTYSFGLDDCEFVVAFETDEPADFLDLVQELRESEASLYTLQDTPLFNCENMGLEEALDTLGGPVIAEPVQDGERRPAWAELCAVADLPDGDSRTIFLEGKMVAVFNVGGELLAINNRCSHARGPLSEGTVNPEKCWVTCPWHDGSFDLRTGQAVDGVVRAPVESYVVEIRDGMIWVGTAARSGATA